MTTLAERQRLARELHDTLSQGLVGLLMQLDAANAHFAKNLYPQGCTIIAQAIERARTMLVETRYVISDLRTPHSLHPDDLPELVQEEIERFTSATGIPCEADVDALVFTPATYCEQVLRVITEGLTNVARHANAHHSWVCATTHAEWVEVEVRDDGVGFDTTTAGGNFPGHYGLIGLRERSRVMGGRLDIISALGEGTSIRIHVPREVQYAEIEIRTGEQALLSRQTSKGNSYE
ncbi:sensor histidine kinase [Ktedonobacteria bacterium brp13]|nr:sensor histidine kinase [Ktedonobacteria bacterium brp13]